MGSSYPAITEKDVGELKFNLPPLPEQRRIAEILDTLDRTIEATQRIIDKLQATRQGLLHDLLTRGLDENGQLRDPERNPELFHETELGLLPRKWEIRTLEATATLQRGMDLPIQDREAGIIPVYGSNGVDGWHNSSPLKTEGVVTGRSGSIGHVFWSKTGYWPLNTTLYVKDFHGNFPRFVALLLKNLRLGRFVAATGVPSLNRNFVHPLLVQVPTPQEQELIVVAVEQLDKRVQAESIRLNKLQSLKLGLMEDLLTGRVRVPLAESEVGESHAGRVPEPSVSVNPADLPQYIPPQPPIAAHAPMYRAATGAQTKLTEWTQALAQAVQGQQVGRYSPEALDAVLPELLALTTDRRGVLQVPEVLAKAGIRFMLLPHPSGSRANGAAFYLDEEHTQPVVGLSLRYPYLDVFWFNLLHELAHIRLGHQPVPDESLEEYDIQSPEEQAANRWAEDQLIPPRQWQAFVAGGEKTIANMRSFARKLGRHRAIVAGRYGHETGNWNLVNPPTVRPSVKADLTELHKRLAGADRSVLE